jgi:hypothetical protein
MALLLVCPWLLGACALPGYVKPTIKIGLSAPFEGRYRDVGYEALYAVRLAVRERNESGGIDGRYLIEFVALNDFCEAEEAVVQARKMAVDPDILGVVGGCSPEVIDATVPEYQRAGLAFLFPVVPWTDIDLLPQSTIEPEFAAEYERLSGGVPPGPLASWAYAEADRLLDAMDEAAVLEEEPSRAGVLQALAARPEL